ERVRAVSNGGLRLFQRGYFDRKQRGIRHYAFHIRRPCEAAKLAGVAPRPRIGLGLSSAASIARVVRPVTRPEGSRLMHNARIPVPRSDELRTDVKELLPLIAAPGREPARTMAVLARQPDLLAPFLGWAAALALQGVLSHREHELLALRAAWNCKSDFEWGEHVEYARAAGLTDDEIAAVARDDITW